MFAPLLQKFASSLRQTVPSLTCLVFILLGVLVWPIPYVGSVTPDIGLAAIYYWAVYRPDLLRPSVVFALGLMSDALNFMPLGLTAFLYVAVYQISYTQRRFFVSQYFPMLWFGFALVCLLSAFSEWLFLSLVEDQLRSLRPVVFQTLLTVAVFPLPSWIFNKIQKALFAGDHHVA